MRISPNGSGKSTLANVLMETLFMKLLKEILSSMVKM